jgi:hypothetical protein
MTKSRRQELSEQFTEQWQRSRDWLVPFMQNNQPKFLTKDELRSAAMRELKYQRARSTLHGWPQLRTPAATIGTSHYADGCAPRASLSASMKLPRKSATAAGNALCVSVVPRMSPIGGKAKHMLDLRLTAFDLKATWRPISGELSSTCIRRIIMAQRG